MLKTAVIVTVWSGGFALLAASGGALAAAPISVSAGLGTAGALPAFLPALAGLGLVGAAGAGLMAMADCGGPIQCVTPGGQCCMILLSVRGAVCPVSCWPALPGLTTSNGANQTVRGDLPTRWSDHWFSVFWQFHQFSGDQCELIGVKRTAFVLRKVLD